MNTVVIGGVAIGLFALAAVILFLLFSRVKKSVSGGVEIFRNELKNRTELVSKIEDLYGQLIDQSSMRGIGRAVLSLRESLKTERGRITITQAELETVEARLRELEEIERELSASAIDTQEELKIMEKKRDDLRNKNEELKKQIAASTTEMESALGEIQLSAEMQEQIQSIRGEIIQTEEKIEQMLLQMDHSMQQYLILKKRYDALDIEYAQLYEKFSAAEEVARARTGDT